jgi:hypothetical protein
MQRTTLYQPVTGERHRRAITAAPLAEPVLTRVASRIMSFA